MIGVYGANGFIGRHLVRRLAGSGQLVRSVSRRFDRHFVKSIGKRVEFIEADLRQPMDMASSLQDIDTVVQLVSTSTPGMKNDHAIADIAENVVPHVQFLENCVKAGIKRYIFLSSGGTVYGPDAPVPTPETSATNPINSHGLTKLTVEKYIQMHGHVDDLQYIILRAANPFGPGQEFRKGQGLIPAILDHWHKNSPIKIFGDGTALRDYLYVDDLIDAIERAIDLPGAPRRIINIGSGDVRSVNEVIDAIEAITNYKFKRDYIKARATDVDVASLDIETAKKMLGWRPKTQFQDGIRLTVEADKG
ncbi:NAD-dependent epimerase/dehydratase family protein (plasmid) [Phyllobacterium sp. A18/5-2]|uniref:NAD-dependent epimerase/dehydratase family protein n=1 Tax=Phyllobacterium sp. A18/5-2 TaxID=2978392 RepID=UPI0021C6D5F4|nr:NAD-dependent epimerase/dehydratase family protein [Phyllobacterium sp. A18/5-2]UXN66751.1 NAD-dependent epimerase/dehydratase family protein [Phyllobacterium sp. A18/5-2]